MLTHTNLHGALVRSADGTLHLLQAQSKAEQAGKPSRASRTRTCPTRRSGARGCRSLPACQWQGNSWVVCCNARHAPSTAHLCPIAPALQCDVLTLHRTMLEALLAVHFPSAAPHVCLWVATLHQGSLPSIALLGAGRPLWRQGLRPSIHVCCSAQEDHRAAPAGVQAHRAALLPARPCGPEHRQLAARHAQGGRQQGARRLQSRYMHMP